MNKKLIAPISRFVFFLLFATTYSAMAIKVGVVLDRGGKSDRSFGSMAFEGATKAEKELGVEIKVEEAPDFNGFESLQKSFAEKKFDLVIAVGNSQKEAVQKMSAKFAKTNFVIVDSEISSKNVKSIMFAEHEGAYLAGALAAIKSKTGIVGFIGGVYSPMTRRFATGFTAGAQKINSKIRVEANYIGTGHSAWNNPTKAKQLAITQKQKGADIIFAAAGASGSGVFDAAEELKIFAIGIDSNQNWIKPGVILSSMLKRVDVAVFDAIKDTTEGRFVAGTTNYSTKNGGIDLAFDKHNESLLTSDQKKKIESIKIEIISGKIKVPDFYKN